MDGLHLRLLSRDSSLRAIGGFPACLLCVASDTERPDVRLEVCPSIGEWDSVVDVEELGQSLQAAHPTGSHPDPIEPSPKTLMSAVTWRGSTALTLQNFRLDQVFSTSRSTWLGQTLAYDTRSRQGEWHRASDERTEGPQRGGGSGTLGVLGGEYRAEALDHFRPLGTSIWASRKSRGGARLMRSCIGATCQRRRSSPLFG